MIAVDTNLLIYAHREDSSWYEKASVLVRQLSESRSPWAIPWPCIHEFYSIVTHPRIYASPTPRKQAFDQIEAWLGSPSLVLLSETTDHWSRLRAQLDLGKVDGPRVHDARIAALCLAHGVRELWSADRDFGRFRALKTRNPLVEEIGRGGTAS